MLNFTLPMPPGINRTYGVNLTGKRHLYKKEEVKDWEHEAGQQVMLQWRGRREPFTGDVEIQIHFYYLHDIDIDASLKVLLDLLQKQGVYKNDRQVRRISGIDITQDIINPRVNVTIEEFEGRG